MSETFGIVVCEHLKREVEAVVASRGWTDVRPVTTATRCDRRPANWDALRPLFDPTASGCAAGCVLGTTSCLPATPLPARRWAVVRRPVCMQLFVPGPLVDHLLRTGAYLVTPGWVAWWERHVAAWGYDRDTARAHFHEFARRVVLLETGTDPGAADQAAAFAAFLDLPHDTLPVGTDFLALTLDLVVAAWHNEQQTHEISVVTREARRSAADSAMIVDLLTAVAKLGTEDDVLAKIAESLAVLLPPHSIVAATLRRGTTTALVARPAREDAAAWAAARAADLTQRFALDEDGSGFTVRLEHEGQTLGVIAVEGLAPPRLTPQYLNTVLLVAPVWSLVLANARTLSGILPICAACKRIRDESGGWHQMESFVTAHSRAEFSHGLCPECRVRLYPDI